MALPEFTIRQLLEAGIHFGHRKHLWNPKMSRYIYGTRKNIHIIDLSQTAPMLYDALKAISDTVAKGGRVLMVGTKRQAQECIAEAAKESAQYFVNARWLGGMLTNWKTVSQAIQRLSNLDEVLGGDTTGRTKKEILNLTRERDKLERNLGGIRDMGGVPNMLFVIDTNREAIAIQEAKRLGIPVVAVLDSNSNPDGITYPIPGNDDAARSITLYCSLVSQAAIDGLSRSENRPDGDSEGDADTGDNEKLESSMKAKSRKTDSNKDKKKEKDSSKSDSDSTADSKKEGKKSKEAKPKRRRSANKPSSSRAKKSAASDKKTEDKAKDVNEAKTKAAAEKENSDTGKKETDKKPADAEKASKAEKPAEAKKTEADKKTEASKSKTSKSDDKSE